MYNDAKLGALVRVPINAVHTMAGVHAPAAESRWKNELESLLAEHEDIIKQHPDAGGVILCVESS